jgi:tetratricopeptide (TPR) repeat protein
MNILLNKNPTLDVDTVYTSFSIQFNKSLKRLSSEEYARLALIYKDIGLNKKVIYLYEKSLSLRLSTLGMFNNKTASSYIRLAEAYRDDGMIVESLKTYGKSLEIHKNIFGEKSLQAATIYSALANIYFSEENKEEAFYFYVQALKIRSKILGEEHPLTAQSNHELGYFYASGEEYTLALPLFEKALDVRIELYRLSHPETAKSYNNLAMCHYHLFHYDKAYMCLLSAIKIKEMIFPKNDERILVCKRNLLEIKRHCSGNKKHTLVRSMLDWIKSS